MPHRPAACPSDKVLSQLVDLSLAPARAREVETHLDRCTFCRWALTLIVRSDPTLAPTRRPRHELVGRFVVLARAGSSEGARRYFAYDPRRDKKVELRLLPTERPPDARTLAAFEDELRALRELDSPFLSPPSSAGIHQGHLYVVTEHVEGLSLARWLEVGARSSADVARVFAAAASALGRAHESGFVHGGITLDSIHVGADGVVRVTGFGEVLEGLRWHRRQRRRHASPEELRGERLGPKADQYSLCACLDEAIGARLDGDVPDWLRRAISRGLSREPAHRFPSLRELTHALRPRRARYWWALAALAGLGGLAGILLGSTLDQRRGLSSCALPPLPPSVHRATLGSPGLPGPGRTLETYRARWSQARETICASPAPRGVSIRCLESLRAQLVAITGALPSLSPDQGSAAASALASLPDPERCKRATAAQTPLTPQLLRARVHLALGQPTRARELGRAELEQARAQKDLGREAHAAAVLGRAELELRGEGALSALHEALWAAEIAGLEEEVVAARLELAIYHLDTRRQLAEAERWARYAHAALSRAGTGSGTSAAALAWRVEATLGDLAARAGRLDEAVKQYERALELIPDRHASGDLARAAVLERLAAAEMRRGFQPRAAEALTRALGLAESWLGQTHPTAVRLERLAAEAEVAAAATED